MITLDKYDVEFIDAAKHAPDVRAFIDKAYVIWQDRCLLPHDTQDWRVAEAMVNHFMPMILEIRPNALGEILAQSNPNAIRWQGRGYVPAYWDMLLFNVAMQLAITEVKYLPGYTEKLIAMGLWPKEKA